MQILWILFESLLIVLIIKIFILSPFIVSGKSMNDSLKENDLLFALKKSSIEFLTGYKKENLNGFLRNKVLVIKSDESFIIKRCIGTEGDTLIFIDSMKIDTFIVPHDSIFVIGDNFRNSLDSRKFGFVSNKKIVGVQIKNIIKIF